MLAPLVRRMHERIRAMEQSRFWRLRNRFFAAKKRLRLSVDGAWPPFTMQPAAEAAVMTASPYAQWLQLNAPRDADLRRMRAIAEILPRRPCISLIWIDGDAPQRRLLAGLASLRRQVYGDWKLCVAPGAHERRLFEDAARNDPRVVIVPEGGLRDAMQLAAAALSAATGDFVGFLRAGDALAPEALFEVALLLNRHADADIIYSDEDALDDDNALSAPYFKPDWSPELLLSRMYIGDLCVYRRSLVESASGLRAEFVGAALYDLALRASEKTDRVYHIPLVLYHRLSAAGEPEDHAPAPRALTEALARRGEPGRVTASLAYEGTYIVRYEIQNPGRVSIIVPTRDHGADVDRCLISIFSHETLSDFEVLLIDNGSTDRSSLEVFERWRQRDARIRVLRDDAPFNFSRVNNRGVAATSGTYLLFLNNDTEVLSHDWLSALVEQAQRPPIAAVGGRLLFPDGTVQHAGVVLGIGGVAGHSHRLTEEGCAGYFGAVEAVRNYSALTAACLMVRRQAFDEVGGFDEALPVAYNDVDLCLKFRAHGYRNVYLPHVVLRHAESKTRGQDVGFEKTVRSAREQLLMKERYGTLLENDPYYSPNLTLRSEDYALRLDG